MAPPRVGVGDAAPNFRLPGTGDREYALSDFAGSVVVLVFYPGDNTPVCTMQLNTYNTDLSQFENLGAQILAISPQSVASHERFAELHGFRFPLLADESLAVGRAYAILGPVGFYRRSVFVIDAEGTIRYAHRASAGLTFRRTSELVEAVVNAKEPLPKP